MYTIIDCFGKLRGINLFLVSGRKTVLKTNDMHNFFFLHVETCVVATAPIRNVIFLKYFFAYVYIEKLFFPVRITTKF